MRGFLLTSVVAAACGGKTSAAQTPSEGGADGQGKAGAGATGACVGPSGSISIASASDTAAAFCVTGPAGERCYSVDLASGEYGTLDAPPTAQGETIAPPDARVEDHANGFQVCRGDKCNVIKVKGRKGAAGPLDAKVNARGTLAMVFVGDAERGKGQAELWEVSRGKKLTTIKYNHGAMKCGTGQVLGLSAYVNVADCGEPKARGFLYSVRGKEIAPIGGADFGTYGSNARQVQENQWAFLEDNGARVAVHDVGTGKLVSLFDLLNGGNLVEPPPATIPVGPNAKPPAKPAKPVVKTAPPPPPAGGEPATSALVRGAANTLVVIHGGARSGDVQIVNLADGQVKSFTAGRCGK